MRTPTCHIGVHLRRKYPFHHRDSEAQSLKIKFIPYYYKNSVSQCLCGEKMYFFCFFHVDVHTISQGLEDLAHSFGGQLKR
jgi:hypothetical protein